MNTLFKITLFFLTVSFPSTGFCQNEIYDSAHRYSIKELQTDFQFLRTKLEKTHPDLYLYTPKKEFSLLFDSLYKSIQIPLTEMDFYNLITLLNSKIKDGHTMFLPSERTSDHFNQNGRFLPFYIIIINSKLYVNMNCSADTSIKEGSEILSINGISAEKILSQLLVRQIRDGNNKTYPIWILTNYFKEYFSFSFGHPAKFSIIYKLENSEPETTGINSLLKDSIRFYRQAKYSNRVLLTNEKQGIVLEMNKQSGIATLRIKSFDKVILNSAYKQDFNSTVQKMFIQIYNARIRNLVLDIRDNQGGDFEPGKLLLSCLLRQLNTSPAAKNMKS